VSVYIAHRLFAAHDRALAAGLAERLAGKIGTERVFLPFCDTDEEDLVAEVKGRRLFELDRERLGHLDAMLALLHGPSLDDGVCMEIGFAAARGVPVVVLTTDFQTYTLTEQGSPLDFPDPLIQAVATHVVRIPRLGPAPERPAMSRHARFRARNLAQLDTAVVMAVEALLAPLVPASQAGRPTEPGLVYVEPSPYAARHQDRLAEVCTSAGHSVALPQRFSAPDPVAKALEDLATACSADRLLADVSGPETPPGTAVLIGAALACGRRIAAFQPRPTFTHAHGREPNWRNLMIQYAADTRLDDLAAVRSWLKA
jgi:nucleoside 2-deoxyribosyltransferase